MAEASACLEILVEEIEVATAAHAKAAEVAAAAEAEQAKAEEALADLLAANKERHTQVRATLQSEKDIAREQRRYVDGLRAKLAHMATTQEKKKQLQIEPRMVEVQATTAAFTGK